MNKITQQNKERFFALYWGQCVGCDKKVTNCTIDDVYMSLLCENKTFEPYYLTLKDINDISEEDIEELRDITSNSDFYNTVTDNVKALQHYDYNPYSPAPVYGDIEIEYVDFFRSKGYALEFMGITVKEMLEAGWIKLNK